MMRCSLWKGLCARIAALQSAKTTDEATLATHSTAIAALQPAKTTDEATLATHGLELERQRELTREHRLSDATFEAARQRLGDAGVVDLIATVGYYAMLAVCHVALAIPAPK